MFTLTVRPGHHASSKVLRSTEPLSGDLDLLSQVITNDWHMGSLNNKLNIAFVVGSPELELKLELNFFGVKPQTVRESIDSFTDIDGMIHRRVHEFYFKLCG